MLLIYTGWRKSHLSILNIYYTTTKNSYKKCATYEMEEKILKFYYLNMISFKCFPLYYVNFPLRYLHSKENPTT